MRTFKYVMILLLITNVTKAKVRIPIPWGTEQKIHEITPLLDASDPEERYYLGYMTEKTHILWIFGVSIENKGYVVGVGNVSDNTYSEFLTTEDLEELKSLQILEQSLPNHPSLSFWDYFKGYSFWMVVVVIGISVYYKGA